MAKQGSPHEQSDRIQKDILIIRDRAGTLGSKREELERDITAKRRELSRALADGDEVKTEKLRRSVAALQSESDDLGKAVMTLGEDADGLGHQLNSVLEKECLALYNEQGAVAAAAAAELIAEVEKFRDTVVAVLSPRMRNSMNTANEAYSQLTRLIQGAGTWPRLRPSQKLDEIERGILDFKFDPMPFFPLFDDFGSGRKGMKLEDIPRGDYVRN